LPFSKANSEDLPAPLRPTKPDFFAGIQGDGSAVEQHLGAAAQGDVF